MRRAEIDSQNRYLLKRPQDYRLAADIIARAWATFPEVEAIAVIGSVAKPLWKEVPVSETFAAAASRSGTNAAISTGPSGSTRRSGSATCGKRAPGPCARPSKREQA
nr:hypothetical protein [Ensifer sp. BR816]